MDRKHQSSASPPSSSAARLALIGDALCLDFANTSSGRGGPKRLEHLHRYADLVAWAHHAGSIDEDQAARLLAASQTDRRAARAVLDRAIDLRERIHQIASALALGRQPADHDLNGVVACHLKTLLSARLVLRDRRFDWRWDDGDLGLAALLGPVAENLLVLLRGADLARLKQCPGPDCGWVFLDRSKNGRRRWCEMRVCGNRAKAKRHHQRRTAIRPS